FAEVLALVPPALLVNCQLYLNPKYVPMAIEQIRTFGLLDQCFLTCDAAQIEVARRTEAAILICSTDGQRGPDSDYPDRTIALGAQFIQLWGWADCMPEVVDRLHANGVLVNYFGTSEASEMRRLIEAGVDYVLTDHLDLMHEVMAEYGLHPRE
ncbi:MAG: glycerophosphodiester phosphodiesterase family protein, partial [Armatimonadota bacterium]